MRKTFGESRASYCTSRVLVALRIYFFYFTLPLFQSTYINSSILQSFFLNNIFYYYFINIYLFKIFSILTSSQVLTVFLPLSLSLSLNSSLPLGLPQLSSSLMSQTKRSSTLFLSHISNPKLTHSRKSGGGSKQIWATERQIHNGSIKADPTANPVGLAWFWVGFSDGLFWFSVDFGSILWWIINCWNGL